jgi:hypothetical protein
MLSPLVVLCLKTREMPCMQQQCVLHKQCRMRRLSKLVRIAVVQLCGWAALHEYPAQCCLQLIIILEAKRTNPDGNGMTHHWLIHARAAWTRCHFFVPRFLMQGLQIP